MFYKLIIIIKYFLISIIHILIHCIPFIKYLNINSKCFFLVIKYMSIKIINYNSLIQNHNKILKIYQIYNHSHHSNPININNNKVKIKY